MNMRKIRLENISPECLIRHLIKNAWMIATSFVVLFLSASLVLSWFHTPVYKTDMTYAINSRKTSYASGGNVTSAKEVAYVMTEMLESGTVMDNIRYGKLDATDEECIHAAKLANAHDFITRLPEGYDTMLTGNGASLSQGQRQLIAIARAAVADPPVMILDEATSSIDTRTEALVQKGMDALMQGRTTFVIAHRLSTIRACDRILVLDKGKIVADGDYETLVKTSPVFAELVERQSL